MFHGVEWRKNHDLIDQLRRIAEDSGRSMAQLVVNSDDSPARHYERHFAGRNGPSSFAKTPPVPTGNSPTLNLRPSIKP